MTRWLSNVPLEDPLLITVVIVVGAVLLVALSLPFPGVRRTSAPRWFGVLAAGAAIGAVAGWLLTWWVVDVQSAFGAPASDVVYTAVSGAGAAMGLVLAGLLRARWWRRALAVVAVLIMLTSAGLVINRDIGYYPTVGDLAGTPAGSLQHTARASSSSTLAQWRPPRGMPSVGTVGRVRVPTTRSHFTARDALVYLPPAAEVAAPPPLPVVIAFSGQPGAPGDVFGAGGLTTALDAIARAHRGVAPIVVVPDQLGPSRRNTFCVDGRLGDVATYVLGDVRDWIRQHLPVTNDRAGWSVAGFSQGATCAVQFGTGHPEIFGSFVAVSAQVAPVGRSVAETIRTGFAGDAAAYDRALPLTIMRTRTPYPPMRALFAVGASDARYRPQTVALAAAARQAGMQVRVHLVANGAHNWHTAADGLTWGLNALVLRWRLP